MLRVPLRWLVILGIGVAPIAVAAQRLPAERLGRGLVAVELDGRTCLSWRARVEDPPDLGFIVEAALDDAEPRRLTLEPLRGATWFATPSPPSTCSVRYAVRPVVDGIPGAVEPGGRCERTPARRGQPYLTIPLRTPEGYVPNDGSVGDLDGDGEYELVLHQAGRGRDNSQAGPTDPPILQAYRLDGTWLWDIRLGPNIREGAHYTQFVVFDFDGDGRAEVACKTADGTVDGVGRVIGDASARHVTTEGRAAGKILAGPEFLTVFDGRTGAALATTNYVPARGDHASWGDDYGNRVDRFLAAAAYLDAQRPSLVACRGYYTRAVLVAWDWRDGRLSRRWTFDTEAPGNAAYRGQGNHGLSVADVDGDGRDEILYGACTIDDDGRGLYSTGLGHGDALHVSDLDPNRPGLEVFGIHEKPKHLHGISFRDARDGTLLWSHPSPDVGRGLAADIDPRHPGAECWAAGQGLAGLFNARGERIAERGPRAVNFAVWWDGDALRELLDRTTVTKWQWRNATEEVLLRAEGCASNNGSKATPVLSADILGDWREEVVWRSTDNRELRIHVTTHPTTLRHPCLMQDSQYRLAVAWQNVGYNQPPHPSRPPADPDRR